ncbi:MAG: hypothetical protein MK212_11710 [Saprospiraceae bacterium]|nr:hypothetical protein [Saprospiraceae bacterium]
MLKILLGIISFILISCNVRNIQKTEYVTEVCDIPKLVLEYEQIPKEIVRSLYYNTDTVKIIDQTGFFINCNKVVIHEKNMMFLDSFPTFVDGRGQLKVNSRGVDCIEIFWFTIHGNTIDLRLAYPYSNKAIRVDLIQQEGKYYVSELVEFDACY